METCLMSKEEIQAIDHSESESEVSFIHRLKNRIVDPFDDFLNADRSGKTDKAGKVFLLVPAFASTLIIILILAFLLFESTPILTSPVGGPGIIVNPTWDPNRNLYGIAIFVVGSLLCTTIAIGIAVPVGIGGAIFLSEFCPMRLRQPIKMITEMMAAIPSIVYGLWAYIVLVPYIKNVLAPSLQNNPLTGWIPLFQGDTNGLSLLAGGVILAIMLLPTVVTITTDALQTVPTSLREASLALGATQSETARKIVISAALPGVGAAIVLALGRAVGETMAVLMVTGNSLQIPYTLFDPTYVMTSIITNQLGYAFVFPLWRSALFAVGLVLMIMSVCFTLTAKLFIRWGMKTRGYI
ncbi:MAG: phosphate ABC transporter permease subunit PstC [Candidatus Thorarchaeota archaeon]|nr:phosphate ABC transporter permease subunit PstC [Candidatus Thorarchaeota archaeon]